MTQQRHHPKHQRSGIVLLIALLLMAAITASTIGVSVAINSTTHQSKNLDDFIIASLTADSGLERGLAVIKKGRDSGVNIITATTAATATTSVPSGLVPASFTVSAAGNSGPLTVPRLDYNQSFSFDLIDSSATGPPSALLITADDHSTAAVLEVSWVLIAGDGTTNYSGRVTRLCIAYNPLCTGYLAQQVDLKEVRTDVSNAPAAFNGSVQPIGYRVRVKIVSPAPPVAPAITPPAGYATNIVVTPYTFLNSTVTAPFPSRISITSTGQVGPTRSFKTATVPWQPPTSPLFDFVLFTEGPIIPN